MRHTKNKHIPWTGNELLNWSEDKATFILMIVTYGWMKNIYVGDPQQDQRLMIIRKWWAANVNEQALYKKSPKKTKFVGETQLKLF